MGWSTHEMEVEVRPDQTVGMVNTRDGSRGEVRQLGWSKHEMEVEGRPDSWEGQHTRWK